MRSSFSSASHKIRPHPTKLTDAERVGNIEIVADHIYDLDKTRNFEIE